MSPRPICRNSSALAAFLALLAAPLPAVAETLLHFTETATVQAKPDEIVAELHADATAASAQEAQSRVNALIAAAVEQSRAVQGIGVSTGAYNVWQPAEPRSSWHASQTLRLRSEDGTALLGLLGALQTRGLALNELSWRLSAPLAQRTQDAAMRQALGALRGRAEMAADALGLRFDSFKDIRLDSSRPGPVMPRMMAAAAMPAPTVASEDIDVTASVDAEAVLQPRP